MMKRTIILLTFLAYTLTLVHSVVPHRHDEKQTHHHEHTSDHHHHDEDTGEENHDIDLTHFFTKAEHHAGAQTFIPSHTSESRAKEAGKLVILSSIIYLSFEVDSGPPDPIPIQDEFAPSSEHFKISLLRAPPAIA
jgi:hypothetical protein